MATTTVDRTQAERYAGWLQKKVRTSGIRFDSYCTDNVVHFDGGWTELSRFKWSRQLESLWHTGERCYFLTLFLEGPPEAERRNVALANTEPYGGARVNLVAPDQTIYSLSPPRGEIRSMRCFIDSHLVESICSARPTDAERAQLGAVDFSGGTIEWLLLRMYREICNDEIGVAIAVEGIARSIAVEIARTVERLRHDQRRHSGGLPAWRMRLVQERLHADGPLPKVSDLADICGMTVRHLGRAFCTETGRTLRDFIAATMAERAKRMLEAGEPVGAVAASLGYASSSSFAQAFFRETGTLPSNVPRKDVNVAQAEGCQ